jgi:hypothetical protein
MGFQIQIEADHGSVILTNYPSGGKAVLAFLMGLNGYADSLESVDYYQQSGLEEVGAWYQALEQSAGVPFFPTCRAVIDCMWGDGSDHYSYREDDYDLYSRHGASLTDEQFRLWVQQSETRWQPVGRVIEIVHLLLDVFERTSAEPLEGFYEPEDTIRDFEALLGNLELLASRKAQVVRLNFF